MSTRRFALSMAVCLIVVIGLAACGPGRTPPPPPNTNSGNTGSTLPDLQIVGADLQKEGLDDGIYSIHVFMENRGSDTSDTFAYGCYWECPAPTGTTHLVEKKQENGLAGGQGQTMATIQGFHIACEPLPSTLRLNCEIDTQDHIGEANENNNSWSGDLSVPIIP